MNMNMDMNMEMITNFEQAKAKIKVCLGKDVDNATTISAAEYGFKDLVLYAKVEIGNTDEGKLVLSVNDAVLEKWNKTITEVIDIGLENINYTIKGMRDTLMETMFPDGAPDDPMIDLMFPPEELIYVVTTTEMVCGAVAIIKAREELRKKFPQGYIVLPSSIHEVIVVPYEEDLNTDMLLDMVTEINAGVVDEEDKLSDNVYKFVA